MIVSGSQVLLHAMIDAANAASMQIIATTHGLLLTSLLPQDSVLVATSDAFVWRPHGPTVGAAMRASGMIAAAEGAIGDGEQRPFGRDFLDSLGGGEPQADTLERLGGSVLTGARRAALGK